MTPSAVLSAYRAGRRHARAIGQHFAVSRTRLQGWGWTEAKIDDLFRAIDRIDEMEQVYDAIGRELDERWPSVSSKER